MMVAGDFLGTSEMTFGVTFGHLDRKRESIENCNEN